MAGANRAYSFGSAAATATTGITLPAAAATLNWLWPTAAGANIAWLRHACGQAANATSVQQRIQFRRYTFSAGSAFTSVTPAPLSGWDSASGIAGATAPAAAKCGAGISTDTDLSGGAVVSVWIDDNFNVLNGYLFVATPPEVIVQSHGDASMGVLWFPTAAATATGWNWYQVYQEL